MSQELRLPAGRVITVKEIPEGMTQTRLKEILLRNNLAAEEDFISPPPSPELQASRALQYMIVFPCRWAYEIGAGVYPEFLAPYNYGRRYEGLHGACTARTARDLRLLASQTNTSRLTSEQAAGPVLSGNYARNSNTPWLTRHAPFAHLRAPRRCQSVVQSVHMPKTRHSGRMFGQKTARKRSRYQ